MAKEVLIKYSDLSWAGLVKVSKLADLLGVPPTRAREIILMEAARHAAPDKPETLGKTAA